MHEKDKPQWVMTVTVWHGPSFGHRVELETVGPRKPSTFDLLGQWTGLGIPEKVLEGILTSVFSVLNEHLLTRYGLQEELPFRWAGDPEPF